MPKIYQFLFLSIVFFSSVTYSYAQQPTAQPARVASPRITSDTARAVSTMFSKHRTGGVIWTVIGAAFAGRILGAGISQGDAAGTIVGVAVFGGVPGAIGISKLGRFSKSREEEALAQYAKTKTLPRYVTKRLKNKYFN